MINVTIGYRDARTEVTMERLVVYVFFFQAEDGIRDLTVTGVQTCALPILYEEMTRLAERLVRGLRAESERAEIAAQINAIGSLATVFFTTGPVRNYADAKRSDTERYARFFRGMLARGVFFAPSQFEARSEEHTSEI